MAVSWKACLIGFGNGVLCYEEGKTLVTLCKGLLFVKESNYLTSLTSFMQQFGVEMQSRDTVLRLPGIRLSLWQGWHPAVMLGSVPPFMILSILVSIFWLLLATGLSWGEKRNVTHFKSFLSCQFERFFFLSPTSPC